MMVDEAKATLLMGQHGSWNGFAKHPLERIPDGTLKQARAFFVIRNREEPSRRLEDMIEAITMVLHDREANSPQGMLAL